MTRPCLQRAVGHASAPSTQPRSAARPVALLQRLHPPQLELELGLDLDLGVGQRVYQVVLMMVTQVERLQLALHPAQGTLGAGTNSGNSKSSQGVRWSCKCLLESTALLIAGSCKVVARSSQRMVMIVLGTAAMVAAVTAQPTSSTQTTALGLCCMM